VQGLKFLADTPGDERQSAKLNPTKYRPLDCATYSWSFLFYQKTVVASDYCIVPSWAERITGAIASIIKASA